MSLAQKSLSIFSRDVAVTLLNIVSGAIVARNLGPYGLGLWAVLDLINNYGRVFGGPRMEISSIYFLSKKEAKRPQIVFTINLISLISACLAGIFLLIGVPWMQSIFFYKSSIDPILIQLILLHLPILFLKRNYHYFNLSNENTQAFNRMIVIQDTINPFVSIMMVAVFKVGIIGMVFGMLAGSLCSLIYGFVKYHSQESFQFDFNLKKAKEMIGYSMKVYTTEAVGFLNGTVSNLISALTLSPGALAFFSMGKGRIEWLSRVTTAVSTILYPRVANLAGQGINPATQCNQAFRVCLIVVSLGAIVISIFLYPATLILYGREFLPSLGPFFILAPGFIFYTSTAIQRQYFLGLGKTNILFFMTLFPLILQITLVYALSSRYGFLGAAIATSIAMGLSAILVIALYLKDANQKFKEVLIPRREDFIKIIELLKNQLPKLIAIFKQVISFLKKPLKKAKLKFTRVYRLFVYGEDLKYAWFHLKSVELVKVIAPLSWLDFLAEVKGKMKAVFLYAYYDYLRFHHSLKEDQGFNYRHKSLTKRFYFPAYKNAVCIKGDAEGSVFIGSAAQFKSLVLWLAKPKGKGGELEVWLCSNDQKILVMHKQLDSISPQWESYEILIPEELRISTSLSVQWKTKAKSPLFISRPFLKSVDSPAHKVLVLILDGIRPQDIGLYSGLKFTPRIDSFFKEGFHFNHSIAQGNWTLPTFASMALSHYPSRHLVVDPDHYLKPMGRDSKTMAELFQQKGFFTYGSVSHYRCNALLGHHRGFEHFRDVPSLDGKEGIIGIKGRNDGTVQIMELIRYLRNFSDTNFFGFVHLFDTHFPYFESIDEHHRHHHLFPDSIHNYLTKSFRKGINQDEKDYIEARYHEKLMEMDFYLGCLFDILERESNFTVILTSDHGYSFDAPTAYSLDDVNIQTPFLMRSTKLEKQNTNLCFVQSSIDLLPTFNLLYALGDKAKRDGRALFDPSGNLISIPFAISEMIYKNKYHFKICGIDGTSNLLFGDMDQIKNTGPQNIQLSHAISNEMQNYLQQASIPKIFKDKIFEAINKKENSYEVRTTL